MNLNCSNQGACPVILDSKCVIYEGENLLYIGVNTNDNYRVALEKINDAIADIILSGGTGITQLTGDVIAVGPGVASATLATVNSTPGQYGSSTAIPKLTVDGKGRVTAITTEAVFIPSGALSFIGDVTGTGNTGSNTTLTLATVNSNVYTSNTFLKIAANAKGLITSATPVVSSDITTALGYTPAPSGNYITDLTGEATASGPGVASVTLNNSAVTGKILSGVNITGGNITATDSILTAFGKLQNQINSLIGGSIYQGVWNAATNTPTLVSSVGTKGYYYIVDVYGTTNLDGVAEWHVGDWAIFDGTKWQKVDTTDAVVSVNGFTGAVSLTTDNIPEGTYEYFTTGRARQAISLTTTGSSGPATYSNVTGILNIPVYSPDLSGYVPTSRTLTINGTTYDLSADRSWTIASGVTSFNTRTGAITLSSSDVTSALGYTPYNSTNPNGYITSSGSISGNAATATDVYNLNYALGNSYYWTGIQYFQTNNGGQAVNNSNSAKLQAYSTSGNSAFMSFHRGGFYAINMGLDDDNVFRIGGWSAAGNRFQMDMSGNLTMAGDVTAYSDARVKENVKTIENALDKVLALRGVSYTRIDSEDKKTKIGVIAQETLQVVPEVVNQDNDGMYNVSYGNFSGLFIEAFKEQQKQIEAQANQIEELKSIINGITK